MLQQPKQAPTIIIHNNGAITPSESTAIDAKNNKPCVSCKLVYAVGAETVLL